MALVIATLTGPEFTKPAIELSRKYGLGTIFMLTVLPGTGTPMMATLKPALATLKKYFAMGGRVALNLPPALVPSSLLKTLSTVCGVPVSLVTMLPGLQLPPTTALTSSEAQMRTQKERERILMELRDQIARLESAVSRRAGSSPPAAMLLGGN